LNLWGERERVPGRKGVRGGALHMLAAGAALFRQPPARAERRRSAAEASPHALVSCTRPTSAPLPGPPLHLASTQDAAVGPGVWQAARHLPRRQPRQHAGGQRGRRRGGAPRALDGSGAQLTSLQAQKKRGTSGGAGRGLIPKKGMHAPRRLGRPRHLVPPLALARRRVVGRARMPARDAARRARRRRGALVRAGRPVGAPRVLPEPQPLRRRGGRAGGLLRRDGVQVRLQVRRSDAGGGPRRRRWSAAGLGCRGGGRRRCAGTGVGARLSGQLRCVPSSLCAWSATACPSIHPSIRLTLHPHPYHSGPVFRPFLPGWAGHAVRRGRRGLRRRHGAPALARRPEGGRGRRRGRVGGGRAVEGPRLDAACRHVGCEAPRRVGLVPAARGTAESAVPRASACAAACCGGASGDAVACQLKGGWGSAHCRCCGLQVVARVAAVPPRPPRQACVVP
jgi:hypothetical protein